MLLGADGVAVRDGSHLTVPGTDPMNEMEPMRM
jgi:hypothetical protein